MQDKIIIVSMVIHTQTPSKKKKTHIRTRIRPSKKQNRKTTKRTENQRRNWEEE